MTESHVRVDEAELLRLRCELAHQNYVIQWKTLEAFDLRQKLEALESEAARLRRAAQDAVLPLRVDALYEAVLDVVEGGITRDPIGWPRMYLSDVLDCGREEARARDRAREAQGAALEGEPIPRACSCSGCAQCTRSTNNPSQVCFATAEQDSCRCHFCTSFGGDSCCDCGRPGGVAMLGDCECECHPDNRAAAIVKALAGQFAPGTRVRWWRGKDANFGEVLAGSPTRGEILVRPEPAYRAAEGGANVWLPLVALSVAPTFTPGTRVYWRRPDGSVLTGLVEELPPDWAPPAPNAVLVHMTAPHTPGGRIWLSQDRLSVLPLIPLKELGVTLKELEASEAAVAAEEAVEARFPPGTRVRWEGGIEHGFGEVLAVSERGDVRVQCDVRVCDGPAGDTGGGVRWFFARQLTALGRPEPQAVSPERPAAEVPKEPAHFVGDPSPTPAEGRVQPSKLAFRGGDGSDMIGDPGPWEAGRAPDDDELERITGVAMLTLDGVWLLPAPARHYHVIHAYAQAMRKRCKGTAGFTTTKRTFVTRDEAEKIARAAGQLLREPTGTLTSEDLWTTPAPDGSLVGA